MWETKWFSLTNARNQFILYVGIQIEFQQKICRKLKFKCLVLNMKYYKTYILYVITVMKSKTHAYSAYTCLSSFDYYQ